jgi:hypothetical protein
LRHTAPLLAVALAIAWLSPAVLAQDVPAEYPPQDLPEDLYRNHPQRETKIPTEGFWPTKLMMERIFERVADEMASNYEMDDDQRDRTASLFKGRLARFLEKNRPEIQSLMNEFFEVQLHNQAPSPQAVATWSQRVLPLLDDLKGVVEDMTEGMREYFTDDQVTKLEGELAAFHTGLTIASAKLGTWAAGQYDPEREWFAPGPGRERMQRDEAAKMEAQMADAQQQAERTAADEAAAHGNTSVAVGEPQERPADLPARNGASPGSAPASRPSLKDDWTIYTEDFVRRYDLEPEQEQKARSFLRSQQFERDRYLQRKSIEIDKVTQKALDSTSEDDRAQAKEEADRLQAPVERMFQQLKDKLNTVPTRAQRSRAETASRPARAAGEVPDSAPAVGSRGGS